MDKNFNITFPRFRAILTFEINFYEFLLRNQLFLRWCIKRNYLNFFNKFIIDTAWKLLISNISLFSKLTSQNGLGYGQNLDFRFSIFLIFSL